jgi:hypothetical protein
MPNYFLDATRASGSYETSLSDGPGLPPQNTQATFDMDANALSLPATATIDPAIEQQFVARTLANIRLGPLTITIRSNESSFTELQHFAEHERVIEPARTDCIVTCCNTTIDCEWELSNIRDAALTNYRAARFASGYYLTDHFGEPATLVSRDRELWIFARDFRQILWPFVIKYILTVFAISKRMLHLKAAAVSLQGGSSTLLVGRGGTGKTILLTQLCQNYGAGFLTNTHALIDKGLVLPVPSAMRVREDQLFRSLIAARNLPAAIKPGEFLVNPYVDLGWKIGTASLVRNICLLDYRPRSHGIISELDKDVLFNYMDSFSLAANIYGLKEDILDFLKGDVSLFSDELTLMKARMRELVETCRGFYVSADSNNPKDLEKIWRALT